MPKEDYPGTTMARKPKTPSPSGDPTPSPGAPGTDATEKTQIMVVGSESAMETTQIIHLDTFEKTQKLAVMSEVAMEATQILQIGALEETPKVSQPPESRMETTLILNPGAQESTQKMLLVSEPETEAAPAPTPAPSEATVAIPVHLTDPVPEEDSRSTLALTPQGIANIGMPERRPMPSVEIHPFDSVPEPATNRRGMWLFGGAALVAVALGIWYLVDGPKGEVVRSGGSAAAATIPAPVPPAYQETLKQAQAGDANAMRTLGAVYAYGLGVPPHRREGVRWYKKAAAAGSAMAAKEAADLEAGGQ